MQCLPFLDEGEVVNPAKLSLVHSLYHSMAVNLSVTTPRRNLPTYPFRSDERRCFWEKKAKVIGTNSKILLGQSSSSHVPSSADTLTNEVQRILQAPFESTKTRVRFCTCMFTPVMTAFGRVPPDLTFCSTVDSAMNLLIR